MALKDGKWRQPLLRDGSPLPVAAYVNRSEARVDFSIGCQDLLENNVEDVKCFCVAHCGNGSVSNMPNMDGKQQTSFGKSGGSDMPASYLEIGRTEVVYNSANPDFSTIFTTKMSTHLGKIHDICISVYGEEDVMSDDLQKQRYLGSATFRLERVLRADGLRESKPLETGGFVTMSAMLSDMDSESLVFCYSGRGFKKRSKNPVKKKFVPKNPYIVISYKNKRHSKWRVLWKSEVQKVVRGSQTETTNFGFGQFQVFRVNGADEESPIQILAMDWNESNHKYKTIGQAETTLREMSEANELDFMQKGKCTGHLIPDFVERVHIPTICNYFVHGGCSLEVIFAVDFTNYNGGADGNPESVDSLHHLPGNELNSYQTILKTIGAVIEEYVDGPKFQAWGFGSILEGTVDHRFILGKGGICDGVQGLMEAYTETVRSNITMSGPKVIRPTIDAAIEQAMQHSQSASTYSVLFVLSCDGAISDIAEVMEKVSQASFVPLSIIFVGIGNGNHSSLSVVEEESANLVSPSGNEFMRDVASVVKLSDHNHDIDKSINKIFEKIPLQIVQYNISNNIFPPEQSKKEPKQKGGDIGETSRKTTAESSMETVVTNNKSTTDYGKFLRDSMVALDFDEEDLHTSEAHRVEAGSSDESDMDF